MTNRHARKLKFKGQGQSVQKSGNRRTDDSNCFTSRLTRSVAVNPNR